MACARVGGLRKNIDISRLSDAFAEETVGETLREQRASLMVGGTLVAVARTMHDFQATRDYL